MTRYIAFLRAINVGGHVVKMNDLRQIFGSLGFSNVETFIASGNVVFETKQQSDKKLQIKIQDALRESLGFDVATFVRTSAGLAAVANYQPFGDEALARSTTFNIAFLAEPLDAATQQKLLALQTEIDDLHIHGREVYWLCRKKQSESKFSNARLEKTTGKPSTIRNVTTVKKMAAKFCDV